MLCESPEVLYFQCDYVRYVATPNGVIGNSSLVCRHVGFMQIYPQLPINYHFRPTRYAAYYRSSQINTFGVKTETNSTLTYIIY